jgi:hypothetical protein
MKDMGGTPNSGKHSWDPIKSPKQNEPDDGVLKQTGKTLPTGAARPDDKGRDRG